MENYINNYFGEALFPIGIGMSKIGSQKYNSQKHIKDRLDVIDFFSKFGKIFIDTASIYGNRFKKN